MAIGATVRRPDGDDSPGVPRSPATRRPRPRDRRCRRAVGGARSRPSATPSAVDGTARRRRDRRRGRRGARRGRPRRRRCSPAGRAWSRCCRCGWPRPPTSSTSTGCPGLDARRRARRAASASGPWPGTPTCAPRPTVRRRPAAAAPGAAPRRPPRRSATAARRSGPIVHADPAAEMPTVLALLGGLASRSVGAVGPAHDRRGRLLRRPARVRRSPHDEIAVAAFFPALPAGQPASRSTRSPAATATTPCAGSPLVVTLDGDAVAAARASASSRSTTGPRRRRPHRPPRRTRRRRPAADAARAGHAHVDPEADIHATADYRAHLVAGADPARALAAATDRRRTGGSRMSEPTTEQLHDVTLLVNGVAARACGVPARRLLSDALRHDLGLTGTHVGCEHGVCGACTVLRRRRADAVLPDVRGLRAGRRDHHRRGTRRADDGVAGPGAAGVHRVPRAAVRLLHAGLPDHDHRRPARRTRDPTPRRGRAR